MSETISCEVSPAVLATEPSLGLVDPDADAPVVDNGDISAASCPYSKLAVGFLASLCRVLVEEVWTVVYLLRLTFSHDANEL